MHTRASESEGLDSPGDASSPYDCSNRTWVHQGRIPALDGLRAVSIFLVLSAHLRPQLEASGVPRRLTALADGHLGVTCFFVISGFLITLLMLRELRRSGAICLRSFYTRRFLRVVPALAAYLSVIASLQLVGGIRLPTGAWIAALTYTTGYWPHQQPWVLGHTWSLSVEEHFYLLWPLGMVLLGPRRAQGVLLIYLALVPVLRWTVHRWVPALDLDCCSVAQMGSIGVGCLLAFVVTGSCGSRVVEVLQARPGVVLAVGLLTLLASRWAAWHSGLYTVLWSDPVNAVAVAAVVSGLVYSDGSVPARFLDTKPVVLIGLLSYSVYLWQQPFTDRGLLPESVPIVTRLALVVAAASVSYWFIERPCLRIKNALIDSAVGRELMAIPSMFYARRQAGAGRLDIEAP